MEDIKMTATKAFYAKLKPELDAAFSAVMASMGEGADVHSNRLTDNLKSYFGLGYVQPCANARDAFRVILKALGLPTGAEVILPAFGDSYLAEEVVLAGLKPVFADVNPNTFTLDEASVERVITPATKVMVLVHVFGQCAEMEALLLLAEKYNLLVIEDATQAFGAEVSINGRMMKAGSIGHIGITSFFPTKATAHTEEGAAILTHDVQVAEKLMAAKTLTQLDALQAAMLAVKVKHIDTYNAGREPAVKYYNQALAGISGLQLPVATTEVPNNHQHFPIVVKEGKRDALQQYLASHFIPSVIPFPTPVHLQEKMGELKYKMGDFPVAEMLSESILLLPLHSELKEEQLAYICQHIRGFFAKI
ncbi:DegT/DnrJ/EryC1/StrS family aminotransferase [Pontibacter arcticus]|uniref:dTDP-4-amino-4,6-dideoxygalactose transaminase n=1 Tax=Pontibacter arcticus TaxID=2080288 RepID=A0A364RFD3_9BACT|nr:DegT/DnrJ/EryC1/StrS family aminotransferase [Pontibacter arcticus]RAU82965.1 hypothetical protein DP923_06915 [Pontibacter arcticus]